MPRSHQPRKRHNTRKTAVQDLTKPPHIHQAYTTFAPIYALVNELRTGEISAADGLPIMSIWGGDQCEVCPAIEGWISCWERIVEGEGLPIDIEPLRALYQHLLADELLTPEMIDAAEKVTDQCYRAYCRIPRERTISYTKTEQIAIKLDEMGLREAT